MKVSRSTVYALSDKKSVCYNSVMLKRKYIAVLLGAFLLGCGDPSAFDLNEKLNEKVDAAQALEPMPANHMKPFYAFYIEPSIGRLESTRTSNTFVLNGNPFTLNLNVPAVINEMYYEKAKAEQDILSGYEPVSEKTGTYIAPDESETAYTIRVYRFDKHYWTQFDTAYFSFYAVSDEYNVPYLAAEMMKIARTMEIEKKSVAAAYSTKENITYESKKIELFEHIAPENGLIEELFIDDNVNVAGEQITDEEKANYHSKIDTDEAEDE